jgi:phosphoglycerate dehydrogenase-like enzyme
MEAATELGILVSHSPTEPNWGGVAEGVFAYILTMLKMVREKDRHVKEGGWRDAKLTGTYIGPRLDGYQGITLGIIGLGRIGSRLADLFQPWRIKILACDPYIDESKFVHHNATPVDMETLLRESDIVTAHCNLTKETTNLIGENELARMKSSAILVNAARGPIVDIDALFDALDQDRIAGAVLDVLPEEPPDPQTPILGLGDKVLLSPHMITANHGTGLIHAIPWVEEVVYAVLKGEVPEHVVNEEALPKWLERFGGRSLI